MGAAHPARRYTHNHQKIQYHEDPNRWRCLDARRFRAAHAVSNRQGVKLEIQPTNPANRIAFLKSGKVDLVFANFTITDERKKEVDFRTPYFASGTQCITKKSVLKTPQQLNNLRIGADIRTMSGPRACQHCAKRVTQIRIVFDRQCATHRSIPF